MQQYKIEDYSGTGTISLMGEDPIFEAETGRKALSQYFKKRGINQKVKVSGGSDVHFKVTPIVIENGRVWIDRRGGKRAMWYQIQN